MNTLEKLKVHKILSALTIAIGFVLMLGKIYADSEPGCNSNTAGCTWYGMVFHHASPNSVASEVTSRMVWHARRSRWRPLGHWRVVPLLTSAAATRRSSPNLCSNRAATRVNLLQSQKKL
jgi:hypothetical protein